MEIFKQIAPLKAFLKEIRKSEKTIGLVPTMGALHDGHLSLINASKAQNQVTAATIYINPTQFNNPADLAKYPRSLDEDVAKLEKVGCDAVFIPDNSEMYESATSLKFDFGLLGEVMEGKYRPGHFSGVALVVSKLFNIIRPDNAYFGQKDWQQFAIIQLIARELKFDLALHSVATYREPDGLAMSSRNLRLNPRQRKHANVFYNALLQAKKNLQDGKKVSEVKHIVSEIVGEATDVKLEYFEVADSINLNVLEFVNGTEKPILCIAGYVGDIRLIDNMFLK